LPRKVGQEPRTLSEKMDERSKSVAEKMDVENSKTDWC
jgi:hypothetical protein